MSDLITYPRLYLSGEEGGATIASSGDEIVSGLFKLYMNQSQNINSLNFRLKIIDASLRLFGDFNTWINNQQSSFTTGYNYEFLRDTARFIETGEREMNPLTWLDLVHEVDRQKDVPQLASKVGQEFNIKGSTPDIIQQWCGHRNGFEDLLQSLFLFFGCRVLEVNKAFT